jgi:hypothetical protein
MDVSLPLEPSGIGTPALRKYFCAKTSVATWLQNFGTSTLFNSNTFSPIYIDFSY